MTLKEFKANFQESFIKPILLGAPGKRITDIKQLDDFLMTDDTEFLVTDIVDFISEWKVSVWDGKIETIFHSKKAWDEFPASGTIELMVEECIKHGMKNFVLHVGIMPQYYTKRGGQTGERNVTVLINVHGRNEHKRSESNSGKTRMESV